MSLKTETENSALKQCKRCKEFKELSLFSKDATNKDRLRTKCRACRSQEGMEYHKANPAVAKAASYRWYMNNKKRSRNSVLKRKYKITLQEYDDMLRKQEYRCVVCTRHQNDISVDMSVDHCHLTGKVRSILCNPCNAAIGFLKENIESAKRLVAYLEIHKGGQ